MKKPTLIFVMMLTAHVLLYGYLDFKNKPFTLTPKHIRLKRLAYEETLHDIKPFKRGDFIIYSVYFDFRNSIPMFYIYGFRDCTAKVLNRTIYARFYINGFQKTVSMTLPVRCRSSWSPRCDWNTLRTTVPLPNVATSHINFSLPVTVSLDISFANANKSIAVVPVVSLQPAKNSTFEHTLALCVQPMFYFADLMAFVQFIETWKALGADFFYVYVTSVSKDVYDLMRAYEDEGVLQIVPWSLLPVRSEDKGTKIDPNSQIYRYGMGLAMSDCLLRRSGQTEFLGMFDLDEYLIPTSIKEGQPINRTLLMNIIRQVLSESSTGVVKAGFSISAVKVDYDESILMPDTVAGPNFNFEYLQHLVVAEGFAGPPKILIRPDYVTSFSIHSIGQLARNATKMRYKSAVGQAMRLYHLRRVGHFWNQPKRSFYPEAYMKHIVPHLTASFNSFLERNFDKDRIWSTGIRSLHDIHDKCMKQWRQFGCKAPGSICKHLRGNMSNFYVIYDSYYNRSLWYVLPQ